MLRISMRIIIVLVMLALALPASAQTTPACPDREEPRWKLEQLNEQHKEELARLRGRPPEYDVKQLRAEVEYLERALKCETAEPPITPAPARP